MSRLWDKEEQSAKPVNTTLRRSSLLQGAAQWSQSKGPFCLPTAVRLEKASSVARSWHPMATSQTNVPSFLDCVLAPAKPLPSRTESPKASSIHPSFVRSSDIL